ncbi:MAG: tetratricopeptide repeat protein [Archangium sp.]
MGRAATKLDERREKDRAHALVLKGKFDDAIGIYRALLKQKADDAALWLQLADVFRKRGKLDDAVNAFRSAAQHLEAQGHVARAKAALTTALQWAPGEPLVLNALKALQVKQPVVTPPIPERVKRHLAVVPPLVGPEEISDDDILDSGEPLMPVITAAKPQRGATKESSSPSISLLDELLEGLPPEPEPAKPELPPEIAAIFAAPPQPAPKRISYDALLNQPTKKPAVRTGSNAKLHRPARPGAPMPAAIADIFAKPPSPAPARRRDTRPPPPVPSLLGADEEVASSGFEHILDHVFSADDEMRTDPFSPRWEGESRETVVARPRGKSRLPAYPVSAPSRSAVPKHRV